MTDVQPLVLHLLDRGGVSARAFAHVLRSGDEQLIGLAARRVDLTSTVDGSPPLHVAARAASSAAVKVLLERGVDVNMKNAEGKTAVLVVREALLERPDAFALSETEALLQVRAGAKPLPIATDIEYAVGDAVHHKKLGDGIVESVRGEGPEARLEIRFASETRFFLAKLVTPKTD